MILFSTNVFHFISFLITVSISQIDDEGLSKVKCIKLTRKLLSLLSLPFVIISTLTTALYWGGKLFRSELQARISSDEGEHRAHERRRTEDLCLSFCYSNFFSYHQHCSSSHYLRSIPASFRDEFHTIHFPIFHCCDDEVFA